MERGKPPSILKLINLSKSIISFFDNPLSLSQNKMKKMSGLQEKMINRTKKKNLPKNITENFTKILFWLTCRDLKKDRLGADGGLRRKC